MMGRISESARTRPPTAAMDAAPLAAYLRDCLGGADAVIHVVRRLSATYQGPADGRLLRQLGSDAHLRVL